MDLVHLRTTGDAGQAEAQAVIHLGRRALLRLALIVALIGAASRDVRAHDEPYSFVDVHLQAQSLTGQVAVHIEDLAHELGLATLDSLRARASFERALPRIHTTLERLLALSTDGKSVQPRWTSFELVPERNLARLNWDATLARPPAVIQLQGPLFLYDKAHETYFNVHAQGAVVHQDLLDAGRTSSTWATGIAQSRIAVVTRFIREGIHHIFIGPDHILFIVALMLCGGRLRRLLQIVTGFTVAHSVTLALAALGILKPPARLVESAIALSIIYVGADNLLRGTRGTDRRALIAAGFGFVHGFGFANVLGDLGLPRQALAWALAAFNVGVELGQACIVLAVAPLLALVRARRPQVGAAVVTAGSALVIAAGAYWFVQRALLS